MWSGTPRKESSSARGDKIKKVGIAARHDIEKFFGKKVFLELFVKVEKDWRNRDKKLREFGYME